MLIFLCPVSFHEMETLICCNYVVSDQPFRDKGWLFRRNNIRKHQFQTIRDYLGCKPTIFAPGLTLPIWYVACKLASALWELVLGVVFAHSRPIHWTTGPTITLGCSRFIFLWDSFFFFEDPLGLLSPSLSLSPPRPALFRPRIQPQIHKKWHHSMSLITSTSITCNAFQFYLARTLFSLFSDSGHHL